MGFNFLCFYELIMIRNAFWGGALIGVVPGLAIAYYLFTHNTWYHDYIIASYSNPWVLIGGAAVGVTIAVVTDRD